MNRSHLRVAALLFSLAPAFRPVDANQTVLPGSVQVSGSNRDDAPAAAFNTVDKTWLVVWRQTNAADGRLAGIFGRVVREDRSFVTAPFQVIPDLALMSAPRVAHEPIRNEWMVVSAGLPPLEGFFHVSARKVASNGALIGAFGESISIAQEGSHPGAPHVAAGVRRNTIVIQPPIPVFVVVWEEPLNLTGPSVIVGRTVTDDPDSPTRIGIAAAQFRIDTDPALPPGRNCRNPRITEFGPLFTRRVFTNIFEETHHHVVYDVLPGDGSPEDIYLSRISVAAPVTTVRVTATPNDAEVDPVVAWNPVTRRTMVLFDVAGTKQGVRGQLLGPAAPPPFELIGPDFAVAPRSGVAIPIPTQSVSIQHGTDIFFASTIDQDRFGLGCIAGAHVFGTPAAGAALGAQTFLSPSLAGNVLLAFRRHDAAGNTIIRASILTVPPAPLPNSPPVARAGNDVQLTEGTLFSLDGLASSDPNADPLRFLWSRTGSGDAGDFFTSPAERTKGKAQLQAPVLGPDLQPIALTFQLAVDDFRIDPSFGATDDVTVTVVAGTDQRPPIARAGPDRSVDESETAQVVALDGTASSDPDGDPMTFNWTVQSIAPPAFGEAQIPLTAPDSPTPSFTVPRFAGAGGVDVTLKLTVTTARGGKGEDTVVVHIDDAVNEPPISSAGADRTGANAVSEGAPPFQFDGSASRDPNGDAITFKWELVSGLDFNGDLRETMQIAAADTATPSVTATIFSERDFEFRLTVTDSKGLSSVDQVLVRIKTVPMQVTSIFPLSGSPGTRVTIRGTGLASLGTRVFFGPEDPIHTGRIERLTDTEIVVLVPSGGPSRFRTFLASRHLRGVLLFDYHDVQSDFITVRVGNQSFVSPQEFQVSHLEITEAFLSQGLERYPLVQGKATTLHVRVRTSPVGPQSPLAGLSPAPTGATCTAFPKGGAGIQLVPRNVPTSALAAATKVTDINQTVNFYLEPSQTLVPSFRFSVFLYHNGIEVAALRTEEESTSFTPTLVPRILAVHVVPFANGSVDPNWTAADQAAHQMKVDAAFAAFGRIYPFTLYSSQDHVVYHPSPLALSDIVENDGKIRLEQFGESVDFFSEEVAAMDDLGDTLDDYNAAHPNERAQVVVAMIADELDGGGASGLAVPPAPMMADIIRFSIENAVGPVDVLVDFVFDLVEGALCVATLGFFCKDPVEIIVDLILADLKLSGVDVIQKISFVFANSSCGDTLGQEVGHNFGFVNPYSPEHDSENISHSLFDEDNGLTFFSAPETEGPILNPVKAEAQLFNVLNLPKSVMSYAPGKRNDNVFLEPTEYLRIFNVFRADGSGGAVEAGAGPVEIAAAPAGGAAGEAIRIAGNYAFRSETLSISEARPALATETITPNAPKSGFTLAFLDEAGAVLADNPFAFGVRAPIHGHGDDGSDGDLAEVVAIFRIVQAIPQGAARVELRFQGKPLWTRSALGSTPTVQLLAPLGGEEIPQDGELRVRWISIDLDGDEITHSVYYSTDGGAAFTPLAVGLKGSEFRWATGLARGSDQAVVKVVAYDGFHAKEAVSAPLRIAGGRPTVSILSPSAAVRVLSSRPVALSGVARPAGGEAVTDDAAYQWSSSTAGPLGTGRDLLAGPLEAGTHRIRLDVNVAGTPASAEVEIAVLSDRDGDGVDDATEAAHGLNADDPQDLFLDEDADGLATGPELLDFGSDPSKADTDGDGVPDGEEFTNGTSPTNRDTDGDGSPDNADNCPLAPNADQKDADRDGLGDACDPETSVTDPQFRRGDSNGDGTLDLTDAVALLSFLFLGGTEPVCDDASDATDDGQLDISDPTAILGFLFLGSVEPAVPGPHGCGADPTADALTRCEYPGARCP